MRNRKMMVAALCMGLAGASLGAEDRLTVAVYDYTGLPGTVMMPAVELARQAFYRAGIETGWSVCDPAKLPGDACTRPLPSVGRRLEILVMPRMVVRPSGPLLDGELAGYALTGPEALRQPRAWVFYDVVKRLAGKAHRPESLVLGCILAHEAGHVLGLDHRGLGVMRASLSPREMDDAAQGRAFDAVESRRLRLGISRLAAATD